jgi:MFS transporter, DHA1 family, inner membrane transport protein
MTEAKVSPVNAVAIVAMGVAAGCVPALQPILLSGLMDQGRLTTAQIGQAAMAEALGMAISMTFAALMLRPSRLKPLALGAVLTAIFANAGTAMASGNAILLLRGVNGLCSGILLWILVGYMARAAAPGRTFAIYVTSQAIIAFLFSILLSNWILPFYGAAGGYALLTMVDAGLIAAVLAMPPAYAASAGGEVRGRPPLSGIIALVGVAFNLAAIMAFWVYVIPMGKQLGHNVENLNGAVSAAIGVQIAGGLAAAFLATRVKPLAACLLGTIVIALSIVTFLKFDSTVLLFLALGSFSFFWMFVPPFQMPFLIHVDPTLRSAMLIGSAQLLGNAAGPMLSSQMVSEGNTLPAATVALVCATLSATFTLVALRQKSAKD